MNCSPTSMLLFLQHIDIEGPGTMGSFLDDKNHPYQVLRLDQGEDFPSTFENIDAVVSLGGPMNVYEEENFPFLKEEHLFIQRVLAESIPFLGICLGSQLLAKAAGARVGRSPREETGFGEITCLVKDPLFRGLPESFQVFQWHGDMFDIPSGGTLCARSSLCPHQAFRVGPCAYGLQFHVEITGKDIQTWADAYMFDETEREKKKALMLEEYDKVQNTFKKQADQIYNNFLQFIPQE